MALKQNLIANYLGQGWAALMGLAFIPLYIKYLGIESYGLVGLFSVMQVWLGLLDMGLTPTLSREMGRFTGGGHTPQSIRNLLRSVEVVTYLAVVLIVFLGVGVANWAAHNWLQVINIPSDVVEQALVIMVLVVGLRLLEGIYKSCIVGLQQQVLLNVAGVILTTFRWLGAAVVLIWVSPTIKAFFYWQGVSSLLSIAVLALYTYRLIPGSGSRARFSWHALKGLRLFAGGMLSINILVLLLTQVDKLILSRLLLLSHYGFYMLASTVAGGLYTLISPISQAYYPRLCELHERYDHKTMLEAFHSGAQLVSVIAGSAALVVLVFADTLLYLWTRDPVVVQAVGPLLRILMFGNLLNALMWIPYQTQLAHGWTSLTVRSNTVAMIFVIPAILIVAPRYGATGAAWIWVAINIGYVLISIHLMFRKILKEEKWRWYFQDVLFPLFPAAVTVLGFDKFFGVSQNLWIQLAILFVASFLTVSVAGVCANRVRTVAFQFLLARLRIRTLPTL